MCSFVCTVFLQALSCFVFSQRFQDLDKVPIRCQRMLMRLRRINVKTEHVAGENMIVSDTLSRCPIDSGNDSDISDYIKEILTVLCR